MVIDINKQVCLNILVVLCLVCIIIYLLKQNKQIEQMTNTDDKSIHDAVKKVYDLDIAAIRNLSNLAGELKNGNNVTIPGNLNVTGKILSKNNELLPPGTIIAWKGTTPPAGWALCDGNDGRPNLKGRFILGYGSGKGSSLNSTGGSETHTLTQNEMPAHNHSYNSANHPGTGPEQNQGGSREDSTSFNVGKTTGFKGDNKAHNNMPPYYVLTYIIKL